MQGDCESVPNLAEDAGGEPEMGASQDAARVAPDGTLRPNGERDTMARDITGGESIAPTPQNDWVKGVAKNSGAQLPLLMQIVVEKAQALASEGKRVTGGRVEQGPKRELIYRMVRDDGGQSLCIAELPQVLTRAMGIVGPNGRPVVRG